MEQKLLSQPLGLWERVALLCAIGVAVLVLYFPLWTLSFRSNQYPDPLRLSIFASHLEGRKTELRDDLREVNSLNHYIGMRPLLERDFPEFQWLPFAIGIFMLLTLRVVVLGTLRDLVDVLVLFGYFGIFAGWTFYQRLYEYGHNLAPDAPIKVAPFMPPLFGHEKVGNFDVASFPGFGSYALGAFGLLLLSACVAAFVRAWRKTHPKPPAAPAPAAEAPAP
jgi:hypothetical protein